MYQDDEYDLILKILNQRKDSDKLKQKINLNEHNHTMAQEMFPQQLQMDIMKSQWDPNSKIHLIGNASTKNMSSGSDSESLSEENPMTEQVADLLGVHKPSYVMLMPMIGGGSGPSLSLLSQLYNSGMVNRFDVIDPITKAVLKIVRTGLATMYPSFGGSINFPFMDTGLSDWKMPNGEYMTIPKNVGSFGIGATYSPSGNLAGINFNGSYDFGNGNLFVNATPRWGHYTNTYNGYTNSGANVGVNAGIGINFKIKDKDSQYEKNQRTLEAVAKELAILENNKKALEALQSGNLGVFDDGKVHIPELPEYYVEPKPEDKKTSYRNKRSIGFNIGLYDNINKSFHLPQMLTNEYGDEYWDGKTYHTDKNNNFGWYGRFNFLVNPNLGLNAFYNSYIPLRWDKETAENEGLRTYNKNAGLGVGLTYNF